MSDTVHYSIVTDTGATSFGFGKIAPDGASIFEDKASWQEAADAYAAAPTDLRTIEEAEADAIRVIARLASDLRQRLSGAPDGFKAAIYNQRAEYGRQIVAGTATYVMHDVARSECLRLAAIDLDRARSQGLVTGEDDRPDTAAIAVVWRDLDERLAGLAAEVDRWQADSVAAIQRRRSVDGVAEALDLARADATERFEGRGNVGQETVGMAV